MDSKYHHWEQLCKKSVADPSTSRVCSRGNSMDGSNEEGCNVCITRIVIETSFLLAFSPSHLLSH